jgi:hypothetical protein
MPTPDELLAEAKLKNEVEWGTYVATSPIDIEGVRAFNVGNAVPVSHVERFGLKDAVEKVENPPKLTKAAVHAAAEEKKA